LRIQIFHQSIKSGAQDMEEIFQKRSHGIRFYFQKKKQKRMNSNLELIIVLAADFYQVVDKKLQ